MTRITRPVIRESDCFERGAPLVVEISSRTIRVRIKGQRHSYELSYNSLYMQGAKQQAEADRRDRALRKKVGG